MKPLILGKYQLLELIAVGGMAEVFRAKSFGVAGFEKTVVIKRILPQLASHPKFVDMFINEAKIAARLSHANIVQIFDLGRQESAGGPESYFIAMEYVAGPDLASIAKRCTRARVLFPIPLAIFVAAEVAKGLDYAHRATDASGRLLRLVHRDVSPHNILVSREGEVKLTDFGIARARGFLLSETESGVLKGKYAYMAPEQTAGAEVDQRTDMFALGIVLWEMCTGRRLFKGTTVSETLASVARAEIPAVHDMREEAPELLSDILGQTLRAAQAERYQSAAELTAALEGLLYDMGEHPAQSDVRAFLELLYGDGLSGDPNRIDVTKLMQAFDVMAEDTADGEPPFGTVTGTLHRSGATPEARPGAEQFIEAFSGTVSLRRPHSEQPLVDTAKVVALRARVAGGAAPDASGVEAVRREVGRFHGWFGESPPGEVFALFGFPRAGPFEVERAVRAALRIAGDSLSGGVHWDVGVARGTVKEAPGAPDAGSLAELGRVAAGLADLAGDAGHGRGGVVVVDAETAALGERWFDTRVLPHDLAISMPDDPLLAAGPERTDTGMRLVVRVVGLKGRGEVEVPVHGRAPFVGRVGSLKALGERLAMAAEGQGQVVTLVGPAGIGKTRLIEELRAAVARDGEVGWFGASCAPTLVERPYQLIRDVVSDIAGTGPAATPGEIHAGLDALRPLGSSDHDIAFLAGLYGDAVASRVPGLPSGRPTILGVLGALTRLSIGLSRERPLVFALEDLQWLAASSRDLLGLWLASLRDRPVLVITSCRPDAADDLALRGNFVRITLRPLDEAHTIQMSLGFLGVRKLPVALGRYLVEGAKGNPFFVEELLASLVERGTIRVEGGTVELAGSLDTAAAPSSLRGLFSARRRGVSAEAAKLATYAAVLGARFHIDPLRVALQMGPRRATRVLDELERRGLVERAAGGAGLEYRFTHDLAREVLYDELTPPQRMRLHGEIAKRVESESFRGAIAEPPLELADFLATHHERGPEPLGAVHFLAAAGAHYAGRRDPERAVERYLRALALVENAVGLDQVERGTRLLGLCLGLAESKPDRDALPGVVEVLERFRPMWVHGADKLVHAAALGALGSLHAGAGDVEAALARLEAALALPLEGVEGLVLAARLRTSRGLLWLRRGDAKQALQDLSDALARAEAAKDARQTAAVHIALARAHCARGNFKQCEESLLRTTELASPDEGPTYVALLLARGEKRFWQGDIEEALACDKAALDSARAHRLEAYASRAAHRAGVDSLYLDDFGRAYSYFGLSQQIALAEGLQDVATLNRAYLAFLEIAAGRDTRAVTELEAATAALRAGQHFVREAEACLLLARAEAMRGNVGRARAELRNAYERAVSVGHRPLERAIEVQMVELGKGDRPKTPG